MGWLLESGRIIAAVCVALFWAIVAGLLWVTAFVNEGLRQLQQTQAKGKLKVAMAIVKLEKGVRDGKTTASGCSSIVPRSMLS